MLFLSLLYVPRGQRTIPPFHLTVMLLPHLQLFSQKTYIKAPNISIPKHWKDNKICVAFLHCPPVQEMRDTLHPGNCHRREWQISDSLIFSKIPLILSAGRLAGLLLCRSAGPQHARGCCQIKALGAITEQQAHPNSTGEVICKEEQVPCHVT